MDSLVLPSTLVGVSEPTLSVYVGTPYPIVLYGLPGGVLHRQRGGGGYVDQWIGGEWLEFFAPHDWVL